MDEREKRNDANEKKYAVDEPENKDPTHHE